MAELDLFGNEQNEKKERKKEHIKYRQTAVMELTEEQEVRKCFGQLQILNSYGTSKPVEGKSIHFLSGGNVDLLSYVKWLLLHFPRMKRLMLSAWSIGSADIMYLKRWSENGSIEDIDLLVGDPFPAIHPMEWKKLMEMYDGGLIRNLYRSEIHSKFILIETSGDERIVVESSANCNMNPRVEQSVVTVSKELYDFYDNYFSELFEMEKYADAHKEMLKFELNTPIDESDILQGQ